MKQYTTHFTSTTPQTAPIPEARHAMTRNRAGGWSFEVSDEVRLDRFLILGTADNTYYATARELTREAVTCLDRLLESGKGLEVVARIVEISDSGRAPKNEPAIMALAYCLKVGNLETRRAASEATPKVCRTLTHLYGFTEAIQTFGKKGWGRLSVGALHRWFDALSDDALAYQLIKYRQRNGWTVRDLLRLSHYHDSRFGRDNIIGWAAGRGAAELPAVIDAYEQAQNAESASHMVSLIRDHKLPWEAVPSKWATNRDVQSALFEHMPLTATIRQLGRLTTHGILSPNSADAHRAVERISDREALRRARVHPMAIYTASRTYASGRGLRGGLSWTPVPEIVNALDVAFRLAFENVPSTGKRLVIGVDSSGSMHGGDVMGIPGFHPNEAAAVMAFVTASREPNSHVVAFDVSPREVDFHRVESVREAVGTIHRAGLGGGTNCAVPIQWADQHVHDADAFVIYTDEETWQGSIHPIEAVCQYRERHNVPAKIVSTAFVAHGYTIRGPRDDAGSLAVVGFDDAVPSLIASFVEEPVAL